MYKFKPYDLVHVQEEGYAFVGEVISQPTPDGTIMVRDVPGDPSTMKERKLEGLLPSNKYKWVQYAVVTGAFRFPVDMLRYDQACPVNFTFEEDHLGRRLTKFNNPDDTELIIARVTKAKNHPWTDGRWASFSWRVQPLKTLPIDRK